MARGTATASSAVVCALTRALTRCNLLQAERGDVTGERPMWNDDGSIDYQRQEEFEAWTKAKVRTPAILAADRRT